MNGNEEAYFVTSSQGTVDETGMEQAVRSTLVRHAASVPLQDPPVALMLERGKRRRWIHDAVTSTGVLALVFAGAFTVKALGIGGSGTAGAPLPVTVGVSGEATVASSKSVLRYHATVPKDWKPGAKMPLSTYRSVPSWVQTKDAATELGTGKAKGHPVNLGMTPEPTTCLSFGSNPLVWPEGFYAEGTPLVVFDAKGRPVYVVDQGFTGIDGPALVGYGDGLRLLPGLDLSRCPAEEANGLKPYALAMIFRDAPKQ